VASPSLMPEISHRTGAATITSVSTRTRSGLRGQIFYLSKLPASV
jgi:hypothetical protein